MVETQNLVKRYGAFEALHGVSLAVGKGEVVGLLGPNGAGKTTMMRILTCYHFPTSGKALVNSLDVTKDPVAVKACVGYLPENAPVYQDLKVLEYLKFVAEVRRPAGRDAQQHIERAIDLCGLESVVFRDIRRLSKGYRQRVGLAQAILHDPAILILDEPTSGLDPSQIIEIRELIRGLGREKTVILSTHILQEVEILCGRVVILNQGAVAAQGVPSDLSRALAGKRTIMATTVEADSLAAVIAAASRLSVGDLTGPPEVVDSGRFALEISLGDGENEAAIFDWAVLNGLKILGLSKRMIDLEEVFLRLTREGATDA